MRNMLRSIAFLAAVTVSSLGFSQPAPTKMQVYKNPSCGCCVKWVELFRQQGFTVTTTDVSDIESVKTQHRVPASLASCHTTLVGGYVVEGHVPVDDVKRLLKEKPAIVGIAVPGMPIGSPGMEGANAQAYRVMTFDKAGATTVFATHRP